MPDDPTDFSEVNQQIPINERPEAVRGVFVIPDRSIQASVLQHAGDSAARYDTARRFTPT